MRFRELNEILPALSARGIYAQVVTSAVRPIPAEWRGLRNLEISVSIDGLQPEHDIRRRPATYARILKHIAGHTITVHCTVTRQLVRRPGYLEEFVDLWSRNDAVDRILVSLYTPQIGEVSYHRWCVPSRGGHRFAHHPVPRSACRAAHRRDENGPGAPVLCRSGGPDRLRIAPGG